MHPLILLGMKAGAGLACKWFAQQQNLVSDVSHEESGRIALPPDIARAAFADFIGQLSYRRLDGDDDNDPLVFVRGDPAMTRLPRSREVTWNELPMLAGACYRPARYRTSVELVFMTAPKLQLSPEIAKIVRNKAKEECESAFRFLLRVARNFARECAEAEERERRQHRSEETSMHRADLAALGLGPDASWSQVQAAYRDCCMKYHPDHLTAQNVAPYLVDLAVQRFKDVVDAYRRLKGRMQA